MSYEELDVWRESHKLALEVYKLTRNFPKDERFRIVDQICRGDKIPFVACQRFELSEV